MNDRWRTKKAETICGFLNTRFKYTVSCISLAPLCITYIRRLLLTWLFFPGERSGRKLVLLGIVIVEN